MNEISFCRHAAADQPARALMSSAFTNALSSRRSRFSSRIFSEYGNAATSGHWASSAGRLWYSMV